MLDDKFYGASMASLYPQTNSYLTKNSFNLPKRIITQKQLLADLLRVLLNIPSEILIKKTHSDKYELPNDLNMTHLENDSIRSAIVEANKMGNHLQYIEQELYRLYTASINPIVKTFCEAVFDYLKSFKNYFGGLLGQLNQLREPISKKITILSLNNIISRKSIMLQFVVRCLNVCFIEQEKKPQIVRLLNKLWEIQQEMLPYPPDVTDQFLTILKHTLKIFFQNIKDWFNMRSIPERMEFFIMEHPIKQKLPESFLHQSNQVDLHKLPTLFENQSQGILEIGKTIRFISLYYEDHEQQKLLNYFNIEKQFEIMDEALSYKKFKTFKQVKIEKPSLNQRLKQKKKKANPKQQKPEDNPYEMFTAQNDCFLFEEVPTRSKKEVEQKGQASEQNLLSNGFLYRVKSLLAQILQNINKKCLRFFKDQEGVGFMGKNKINQSVMHALTGIKKFMLLEQGDFLEEFFNSAESIIDKQKGLVSHNKIYSCIDEAIRNSSAKCLPQKVLANVHFDFIKIHDKNTDNIRLWLLFCFWFKQDGPISYIFNSQAMEKLRGISNFIFRLKKGQIILDKIWEEDRNRKVKKGRGVIMSRAIAFRNGLKAFLNNCLNYIFTNLDVIWMEYMHKIEESVTVFEIASGSLKMVEQLEQLTIRNNLLHNATTMSLSLLQKFQKFNMYLQDPTIIIHLTEVDRMDYQLKAIAQIAMKIPELQQMVNYNNYYSRLD